MGWPATPKARLGVASGKLATPFFFEVFLFILDLIFKLN
jgi:hypothetical protein